MRPGTRLLTAIALALLAAPLLGACAEANRVVTSTSSVARSDGTTLYTVAWDSDLYPSQATAHAASGRDGFVSDCFERAIVGAPLPSACLSRNALFNETGAFSRNPLATLALMLAVLVGLVVIAMRRIGRVPAYTTAGGQPAAAPDAVPGSRASEGYDPALRLMRSATAEKGAYFETWAARQRLSRPGWGRRYLLLGLAGGLMLVAAFGLLSGFVAGGELALVTALVIYLGVAALYMFSLTSLLTAGVHREGLYQRLSFFSGIATGMLFGAVVGSLFIAPLIDWDGVRWL